MRYWKRPPIIAVLFAVGLAALAGCSQREAPLMAPGGTATFSEAVSPYTLAFVSRTYDSESNQTTFLYQLQNTSAPGEPASGVLGVFTSVMVEVPDCAGSVTSFQPPDGGTLGTSVAGIYGLVWGIGYDANPDYQYSITFAGDVAAGTVRGVVTRAGSAYLQSLTGPCEGDFTVSGNVFTDTNVNGLKGGSELGISNVTVTLSGNESTQTTTTDSNGNYTFTASSGEYTVSVDSTTAAVDYNESLFQDWEQTTTQTRSVTVGPNSTSNNFGWAPDLDRIGALLDSGALPSNGLSYKWWLREFERAIKGNTNTAYTPAQLLAFIQQIETLALLDEYDFTPGHELQEAYAILNNHAFDPEFMDEQSILVTKGQGVHDDVAFLLRELLTFELNHVSGRGLDDVQLRAALINWSEGVLKDNTPGGGDDAFLIGDPGDFPNILPDDPLQETGTILKKSNSATGGGGTGN